MTPALRPALALALPALAFVLLFARPASAQPAAPKTDGLERAQKAADAVFHWIKLNGDKGASRQPVTPVAAPSPTPPPKKAAAPVAAAPRPAPVPAPAPSVAPAIASTATAATASALPAPEPSADLAPVVLAAAAPTPAPAAPMSVAAQATEPPAPPPQAEPEELLKLIARVDPAIPRQLQQSRFRSGLAEVQFTVGTNGLVQQAKVIKASHPRLGDAAVDAVRQWRFAPLRKAREAAVEVAFKNDGD